MKKEYTNNQITYGFSVRAKKWLFKAGNFSYVCHCNGIDTAHKVANVIAGAYKRTKGIGLDNLGRSNISRMVGMV